MGKGTIIVIVIFFIFLLVGTGFLAYFLLKGVDDETPLPPPKPNYEVVIFAKDSNNKYETIEFKFLEIRYNFLENGTIETVYVDFCLDGITNSDGKGQSVFILNQTSSYLQIVGLDRGWYW